MAASLNNRVSGDPGKPVLFLIHPMGSDMSFWAACSALWAGDYCIAAMDLLGAGKSPVPTSPHSIDAHASDLEALRQQLGFESIVPVGCAVGAMVAAAYAGRYPGRCGALVLSNPGLRTRPEARAMLAQRAADVRTGGMAAVAPRTIDAAFAGCPDDRRRRDFAKRFEQQDRHSYALAIEGMLDADVTPSLARITCPVLIVGGGNDTLLPAADHAQPLHSALEDSELRIIDDGAHFIPYQRPEEFAALVADFLGRRLA